MPLVTPLHPDHDTATNGVATHSSGNHALSLMKL